MSEYYLSAIVTFLLFLNLSERNRISCLHLGSSIVMLNGEWLDI